MSEMRNLAFVDCETTGLDPSVDRMVEIAVMIVNPVNLEVLDRFSSFIALPDECPFPEEVSKINGITRSMLTGAPSELVVLAVVAQKIAGCTIVGHNVSFDKSFIVAATNRVGVKLSIDYHSLDTCSLAWPLKALGLVEKLKLEVLCKHFTIPTEGAHRAMFDVNLCYQLYAALMLRYAKSIVIDG